MTGEVFFFDFSISENDPTIIGFLSGDGDSPNLP